MPVRTLDDAITLANSTRYGLGANVYTHDLETVVRCMREIRAGTVWFNDPLTDNDAGPFGGMKQLGLGRELGQEGFVAFQETSTCTSRRGSRRRSGGIRTAPTTRRSAARTDRRRAERERRL